MAITPPVALTGGTPGKITIEFNNGIFGWTENWYAWITGPDAATPTDMDQLIVNIGTARLPALSVLAAAITVRRELLGGVNTGWSKPDDAQVFGLGIGTNAGLQAPIWNAWWFRESDATGKLHGTRSARGWSATDFMGWNATTSSPAAFPADVKNYSQAISTALSVGVRTFGHNNTAIGCMQAYDRAAYAASVQPVSGVTIFGTNQLSYTVATLPAGLTVGSNGQTVKIKGKRNKCAKGTSGRGTVLSVTGAGPYQIVTDKQFCCNVADLSKFIGSIGVVTQGYFAFPALPNGSTGNITPFIIPFKTAVHKTGRPFGGTAGRRQSRCC